MNEEELQLAAFEIILHSGNARTSVYEAFAAMKEGKYDEAKEKLDAADAELLEAHHAQTDLLQKYASGTEVKIEIIMVHAQDHLMTTMTLKEVAVEMITLYQRLDEKLRDALMLAFPLTMFGSIVVVICNLPFLSNYLKSLLYDIMGSGQSATISIMTVFVTFGIGYYLLKSYDIEGIFGGAISFASFLILTPFFTTTDSGEEVSSVLSLDRLGAKGMFLGMIVAFLAAEIYSRASKKRLAN